MAGSGDDVFPVLDPVTLARAEAALAALADDYLAWAAGDLVKLRAALWAHRPDRLFAVAHDIKGQAGTFGFSLITELADRLCRAVKATAAPRSVILLAEILTEAMSRRLAGDGGDEGRRLLARLDDGCHIPARNR